MTSVDWKSTLNQRHIVKVDLTLKSVLKQR